MSPSRSSRKRKRKDFKRFIFQDDRGPVFCPLCVKEKGEKVKPLHYFPVLVPRRPVGTKHEVEGAKGNHVLWHMDYTEMCVKHALQVLEVLDPKELEPREEDIQ